MGSNWSSNSEPLNVTWTFHYTPDTHEALNLFEGDTAGGHFYLRLMWHADPDRLGKLFLSMRAAAGE